MTNAAIYCRISQDRPSYDADGNPTPEGFGVARQEADCRAYCDRVGWTVLGAPLVDNDKSAYSVKVRPAYQQLLAGIEDGTYDALVVWHPDRLHRSPVEL